jgi:hypothetical protein
MPMDEYAKGRAINGREAIIRDYESLEEMLAAKKSKENAKWGSAYGGGTRNLFLPEEKAAPMDNERRWRGGISSLDGFRKTLNDGGWREGQDRMTQTISDIDAPRVQSIKRVKVWRDDGDEVDIHRVYAGRLEHAWETTERKLVDGYGKNYARIWSHVGFNCNFDPEQFFWRGAVACVIADALEEAGYRVQIMGYHQATGVFTDGRDYAIRFPIKGFDEPLDIPRVASVTAHASFFRAVVFGTILSAPALAAEGLGFTSMQRPPFVDDGDIVIDAITNEAEAREYLAQALTRFDTRT